MLICFSADIILFWFGLRCFLSWRDGVGFFMVCICGYLAKGASRVWGINAVIGWEYNSLSARFDKIFKREYRERLLWCGH